VLTDNLAGLANYPTTQGSEALRQSIADWIARRYQVPAPDIARQILPVNGSREACLHSRRRPSTPAAPSNQW